jgi:hypothetical protein
MISFKGSGTSFCAKRAVNGARHGLHVSMSSAQGPLPGLRRAQVACLGLNDQGLERRWYAAHGFVARLAGTHGPPDSQQRAQAEETSSPRWRRGTSAFPALRDARILARHAGPRTTEHYDYARGNLDRHGVHFLTAYVAGV